MAVLGGTPHSVFEEHKEKAMLTDLHYWVECWELRKNKAEQCPSLLASHYFGLKIRHFRHVR
jgi:hypothetical protein